jgi:hypothetical protein
MGRCRGEEWFGHSDDKLIVMYRYDRMKTYLETRRYELYWCDVVHTR